VRKGKIIFLLVGCLILFLLFKTFGIEKTIYHIKEMGWRFWLIVLICLCNNIFLTYSWKVLINYPLEASFFFKLLIARIAGDTTSSINALGAFAGEPIKALYIKDKIPFKIGLASVVLDRTVHTIANIMIILTGIFLSFFVLQLPLYISIIISVAFILSLLFMLAILKIQRKGIIEFLINKLPKKISEKFMNPDRWDRVKNLDSEIGFLFSSRENIRRFFYALSIRYVSIILSGTLEIYFIMKFMGINISIVNANFIYIFGLFLTGIIFFMPANLGTSEGSYSLALKFLGFDPALGLSVGIIRRLRTFVWSGIGILILFYAGLLKKSKP
jgi:uncharacterized protein (TIRG00374 family)